jgi:tryptophan-rich sensory protein
MNMSSYVRVGIALSSCYAAGFIGSLFVSSTALSWYAGIDKPWFNPPSFVFAPVWIVLYTLMAIALVRVWNRDPNAQEMRGWVPLFFAHLLLNAAWTVFFFGYHAVFVAMVDIGILLVSVFLLTVGAWEIDRRASYLLMPYLAWVLFATILNVSIWMLN